MNTYIRNILAVIIGLVLGASVNMLLIMSGPHLIPPPAGVDVSDAQSIGASIHLFEPKHFVFPFWRMRSERWWGPLQLFSSPRAIDPHSPM